MVYFIINLVHYIMVKSLVITPRIRRRKLKRILRKLKRIETE